MTKIRHLPFDAFPQPEWNTATSVSDAFGAIERARDDDSVWRANNALLYALGNNHAGTYYPVVLAIAPRVEEVLRGPNPWSQYAMVETLIDLLASFDPEPGFETYEEEAVAVRFRREILALKPHVEAIAQTDGPARETARELLEILEAGPA